MAAPNAVPTEKPRLRYLGVKPLNADEFMGLFRGEVTPNADLGVRVNGGQQVSMVYYQHLSGPLDERFEKGPVSRVGLGATHISVPFDYERRGQARIVTYAKPRYYKNAHL